MQTDPFEKLKGPMTISVPIALDDDGYYDRVCPAEGCGFTFKVLFPDWRDKVPEERAYCPFCRHEDKPSAFNTPEQLEFYKRHALAHVTRLTHDGLRTWADRINRDAPKRGLITWRMELKSALVSIPLTPEAAEAMTLRIACEVCRCQVAVVGAAYFCPACGHNSAVHTFAQTLAAARGAIAAIPKIRDAVGDRDAAAQIITKLIEGNIGSLVTGFQRWAEVQFPKLPKQPTKPPRRNAFQNLSEGSQLWEDAGGTAYTAILDSQDLADLRRLFQQRHLLAHCEGLVDQDYLSKSGDTHYKLGQRLVVKEHAALRLADLLEKLVLGLQANLPT